MKPKRGSEITPALAPGWHWSKNTGTWFYHDNLGVAVAFVEMRAFIVSAYVYATGQSFRPSSIPEGRALIEEMLG